MFNSLNFNNTDGLYYNFKPNELPGMEHWKPVTELSVPGVLPIYMVSDWGRIFNMQDGVFANQAISRGYLLVSFRTYNGKHVLRDIHRVVRIEFEGFDPNPDKVEIDHISGEKNNNSIFNTRWVTCSENITAAYDIGLLNHGQNAYRSMNSNEDIMDFCQMIQEGLSLNEIYACMISRNVTSPNSLFAILYHRKAWKRISASYAFAYYDTSNPNNIPISLIRDICSKISDGIDDVSISISLRLYVDPEIVAIIRKGFLRIQRPIEFVKTTSEGMYLFTDDEIEYAKQLILEYASQKQVLYELGYDKCMNPEKYGETYDEYYHRMMELDDIFAMVRNSDEYKQFL